MTRVLVIHRRNILQAAAGKLRLNEPLFLGTSLILRTLRLGELFSKHATNVANTA